MLRRIQIQAHDIRHLFDKTLVIAQLERADQVRLEAVGAARRG